MDALDRYRDKWREVPSGAEGRVFGDNIQDLPDEPFLSHWSGMAAKRAASVVGRLYPLYRDYLAGKRVLELGGGLGFDGLQYAERGAQWTFADIVPSNLAAIRRVAKLKGVDVATHQIGDDLSFDALGVFDAVMVIGSIHHVPFDIARREAVEVLKHLEVGGRWIELVYPRERWVREGTMPFDTWGMRTDGDRTPWAEWHDAEKVRHRLRPGKLTTVLDMELSWGSFRWLDFVYEGMGRETDSTKFELLGSPIMEGGAYDGRLFRGEAGAFRPICRFDLRPHMAGMTGPWRVDLLLEIRSGTVGVGLADAAGNHYSDEERVLDAASAVFPITLRSDDPAQLILRNRHEDQGSEFLLRSVRLREA
jgi:hypothetical protein